ncbi:HNH endonuclease [Azospirillum sp. TSO22-1]|uniref:HNH endonuclease n=1 Tax=Azospirillum sp. TSO22-1 TaxID=716789 RepID=UPI000D654EC2|nr:HNH endonuclease [Azospirillum sp. TSO22-1]
MMPGIHDLTVADIRKVLTRFRTIGRKRFLAEYKEARADGASSHFVLWSGRLYDLKAVVYAAYFERFNTPLRESPHSRVMQDALLSLADGSVQTYYVPHLKTVQIPEGDNGFRTVLPNELVNKEHFHRVRDFGHGTAETDDQNVFLERLDEIVVATGNPRVPWIFREASGGIRKIDKGRARFTLNGWRAWTPLELEADDYLTSIVVGEAEGSALETGDAAADGLGTVERQKATGLRRPEQERFRNMMLTHYRNRCAVTGAATRSALDAAHIRSLEGQDDNGSDNGILLRTDVHRLFDQHMITLSVDGLWIEVSPSLIDPHYAFLSGASVSRPFIGAPPSREKIAERRRQFHKAERKRKTSAAKLLHSPK